LKGFLSNNVGNKETDYAVQCVMSLARKDDEKASVGEIAEQMLIPRSFLAKILQRRVREGAVESMRCVNVVFKKSGPQCITRGAHRCSGYCTG